MFGTKSGSCFTFLLVFFENSLMTSNYALVGWVFNAVAKKPQASSNHEDSLYFSYTSFILEAFHLSLRSILIAFVYAESQRHLL